MFEEHNLSSATCGEDKIEISSYTLRPVHIAIYGHPRFPVSEYTMEVTLGVDEDNDPFLQSGDPVDNSYWSDSEKQREKNEESKIQLLWPIIRNIIMIIIEVFL